MAHQHQEGKIKLHLMAHPASLQSQPDSVAPFVYSFSDPSTSGGRGSSEARGSAGSRSEWGKHSYTAVA